MPQNLFLLSSKIKLLREKQELTQSDLARKLGLTRSSINAWEMGLSVPSTNYIVELSKLFNVSSDYLLGLDETSTLNVSGLNPKQVTVLNELIECMKNENWYNKSVNDLRSLAEFFMVLLNSFCFFAKFDL